MSGSKTRSHRDPADRLLAAARLLPWLSLPLVLSAQNGELPRNKKISWLSYNGQHSINEKWSLHFDGSYRPLYGSSWRQWLVRPGLLLRLNQHCQLSLTYSYFSVHPGGLGDPAGVVREHRLHQQAECSHPWRGHLIRHRFRVEERRLSSPAREGEPLVWKWQDRPRYLLRMDTPLKHNGGRGAPLTLTLYDEVLFSFSSPATSSFEQNRIYGGVTWSLDRYFAVDVGAFYQTFKPVHGGPLEHNLVFVTLLRNNVPLRDLFRWLGRR
jgi:hypothetical protein